MNRILYVTHMFSGLEDLLLNAKDEASGRPSFVKPLIKLIELGYNIDLVVYTKYSAKNINIKNPHFSKLNVYFLYHNKKSIFKFANELVLLVKLFKTIRRENYDFVYTHGAIGIYGCFLARMLKIPCGQRLYGTFLYHRLKQNSFKYIAFRYFREYLSFKLPKNFLIMTNDGTKGDVIHRLLNKKGNYNFHFLLNGVDFSEAHTPTNSNINQGARIVFYPGRLEEWKQQHLALKLIKILVNRGEVNIKLVLAGYIYNNEYYNYLTDYIRINNLESYVEYVGILNREELNTYYCKSLAVLSFYKYSNLGNVVIEALYSGGLVISLKDKSLDNIITNGYNGFLVENMEKAANYISELMVDKGREYSIKENALASSRQIFTDWETRSCFEIDCITHSIDSKRPV